jgi:hypothetical protein
VPRQKVRVEDKFHYMDETERHEHGVFDIAEKAIGACKRIVDQDLKSSFRPGE